MKVHTVEGLEPVVGLTEFHFRCLEKHIAECDEGLMEVVTSARTAKNEEPANGGVCALCSVLQAARMLTAIAFQMSHRLHASAPTDNGCACGQSDACSELASPIRDAHKLITGLHAKLLAVLDAEERSVERANTSEDIAAVCNCASPYQFAPWLENYASQEDAVDIKDAAAGYLVRGPKRRLRIVTKPASAVAAAMAEARHGSGRGDVFALVPVGTARRGAEWKGA